MDPPFQTSPGASATPEGPHLFRPERKPRSRSRGGGGDLPEEGAEGRGRTRLRLAKKLEEAGEKQAVADLNTETLTGGHVTPRTDAMRGMR